MFILTQTKLKPLYKFYFYLSYQLQTEEQQRANRLQEAFNTPPQLSSLVSKEEKKIAKELQ